MNYFELFPTIQYNLSGVVGDKKDITDIWRKVKVRSKIANNLAKHTANTLFVAIRNPL